MKDTNELLCVDIRKLGKCIQKQLPHYVANWVNFLIYVSYSLMNIFFNKLRLSKAVLNLI